MAYAHIGNMERRFIAHIPKTGSYNVAFAAGVMKRHPSTIYREKNRNADADGHYVFHHAQRRANARRHANPCKLDSNDRLRRHVLNELAKKHSPRQISKRLAMDFESDPAMRISHTAIYDFVARDRRRGGDSPHGGRLYKHLRCGGKRYRRRRASAGRTHIPQRIGIEQRPAEVSTRQTLGHFEADTLHGAKTNACLVTLVERKTRHVLIRRCPNRKSRTINHAILSALSTLPGVARASITFDNGSEFARHAELKRPLGIQTWFANPYSAWERGSNENVNKLIRQWFPKGTNFSRVSDQAIAEVERLINNRPRQCLNWRHARETLNHEIAVALGG